MISINIFFPPYFVSVLSFNFVSKSFSQSERREIHKRTLLIDWLLRALCCCLYNHHHRRRRRRRRHCDANEQQQQQQG